MSIAVEWGLVFLCKSPKLSDGPQGLNNSPHIHPACSPTDIAVAALGDESSWTFAAGVSVKSAGSRREGWEPPPQLPQLLPTCFFYSAPTGIWDNFWGCRGDDCWQWAVSRPLAFTAKVQMLCLFEAHLAGRLLDSLLEGGVTDVPSNIEPSHAGKSIVRFTGSAPRSITQSQYLLQPDHGAQQFF